MHKKPEALSGVVCIGFQKLYQELYALCLESRKPCQDLYAKKAGNPVRGCIHISPEVLSEVVCPSLISLMVSVDVKHHVYLLTTPT